MTQAMHPSHIAEPALTRVLPGQTLCTACSQTIRSDRDGVLHAGAQPCPKAGAR